MTSPPKLLDQLRHRIRALHYSIRTEEAYVDWVRRFILFHDKRHPREMGVSEIEAFLSHLAVARQVSASTQTQARSALLFLYSQVFQIELPWLDGVVKAKQPQRLPVVMTRAEVAATLGRMVGVQRLVAGLLYGSGLRLMEALRLRVKDVDFSRNEILVRDGKGAKDRITMLPLALSEPLQRHLEGVRDSHQRDLAEGFGDVYLPFALARKYPNAPRQWGWQYVFPAPTRSVDPRDPGASPRRHHVDEKSVQRAMKQAVRDAGLTKPATHIRCVIPSPRTCWSQATTSVPCRSCWVTRTCGRR